MDKSAVVRAAAHGIMCLDMNFLHFMTLLTRHSTSSSFVFDVNWRRKRNGRERHDAVHASSSSVSSSSSSADDREHHHHHQHEQRGFRGKNTVTTALSDKNKVEVFVFIDCDNVRPRLSASDEDEDAASQRFLHAFHRAASFYGDVVSLSLYGNEKTFGEEVKGDVKRGGEEDKGEGEGGWTRATTNERNTKKKSLGEALESVRILGSRVRVVRTQSRRKQSADIRCVSDVVDAMRKSADNETTTTTEKLRLAFIVSKDAGLLKEAASPYVRKRGDVVICGDFINNVGMREIDSHPIEDAYRELVEKKIGWSSGVKIKGKPGSEALAIGSRLVSWKDESVWFYAKSDEDKRRRKSNAPRKAARKRREDPHLFMIPGPSSSEKEMEEKEKDERLYQNCVRHLPSSIQTEMRDIIDAYCRRRRNVDTAANENLSDENNNTVFLSKLLRREAKRKLLPVRSNACFASASEVLVYFDAGPKLGAVFGKWLENGDLEMLW